jgi:3'-phosphoadenosine 5'-phosphosulfate sulfotransferase (PAPS reductase)/FAD synthetase
VFLRQVPRILAGLGRCTAIGRSSPEKREPASAATHGLKRTLITGQREDEQSGRAASAITRHGNGCDKTVGSNEPKCRPKC